MERLEMLKAGWLEAYERALQAELDWEAHGDALVGPEASADLAYLWRCEAACRWAYEGALRDAQDPFDYDPADEWAFEAGIGPEYCAAYYAAHVKRV